MDVTGWLSGQVFLQTVDEREVERANAFLTARGVAFQVLTLSERMTGDDGDPASTVASDRFSIAVQMSGFPQVIAPVVTDLIQRAHSGNWDPAST